MPFSDRFVCSVNSLLLCPTAFRLKNIDVLVGRRSSSSIAYTRCVQHDDVFPAVQTLVCGQPLCGQYVRVVKAPVSALEALTLCEVQVYTGTFDPGEYVNFCVFTKK